MWRRLLVHGSSISAHIKVTVPVDMVEEEIGFPCVRSQPLSKLFVGRSCTARVPTSERGLELKDWGI